MRDFQKGAETNPPFQRTLTTKYLSAWMGTKGPGDPEQEQNANPHSSLPPVFAYTPRITTDTHSIF